MVPVDYAFFAGTGSMLVLRRHGPAVKPGAGRRKI
jgi:hypothetical protein